MKDGRWEILVDNLFMQQRRVVLDVECKKIRFFGFEVYMADGEKRAYYFLSISIR